MHINLKILKCIGFVGLFTAALMGVASFDKTPVFSLWGGLNWENSGKTAEVNLVGSLNNQLFQPTNRYTIGPFVGIDAGERWYFNNRPIYLSLMGELSYTKVVSAYGVEQPQVGSHSDTLNYNYAISDVPLFLVGQFGWYKGMLEGYLIGGIGLSWNTASDFKEIPTNPTSGTASASRGMFQRNTLTEFAYVIGMGADRIIEIATVITNSNLDILAEGPVFAIYQPQSILSKMDNWNVTHHTQSGLLDRVIQSKVQEATAESETILFLEKYVPAGKSPLCGNSICQDRRFLYRYMPKLDQYFHYRHLDVSTLKILAQRWAPQVAAGLTKEPEHLALADIRDSIEELRYYRQHILKC